MSDIIPNQQTKGQEDEWLVHSLLQHVFPGLSSCRILRKIVQANANGYLTELEYYGNCQKEAEASEEQQQLLLLLPKRVFVKHVDAYRYSQTKSQWNDLRRTCLYARTEARWYRDFVPLLLSSQQQQQQQPASGGFKDILPQQYAAEYTLPWIADDEPATASVDPNISISDRMMLPRTTDTSTAAVVDVQQQHQSGGLLVLEYIDEGDFFQDSPLSIDHAKQCLRSVACLHVAAWEHTPLLDHALQQLSRASFHLETRNPSELAGLEESWKNFCQEFQTPLRRANLWTESVQKLGMRLKATAKYLSQQLSPLPSDPYATLAHGDYKAMNVFLPKSDSGSRPSVAKIVDYASIGLGYGMSDVAMHIHHAVCPEDLDQGGEEDLVQFYWRTVIRALQEQKGHSNGKSNNRSCELQDCNYPWEVAWRHYRLAVLDYGRFLLGRFYKSATLKSMANKVSSKNTCLLNRNVDAALAFVRRLDVYLAEVEAEMENNQY